jgi:hypothetical protein
MKGETDMSRHDSCAGRAVSRRKRICLLAGMALGLGLLAMAQEEARKASPSAAAAAAPAAQSGMRAFIDPVTKQLRPGEIDEYVSARRTTLRSSFAPQPVQLRHLSGAAGVRLGRTQLVYSVATIGPDGRLKLDCVTGDKKAGERVMSSSRKGGPDVE